MADQLITSLPGLSGNIVRYKDMGDGTVAEVMYNVGAGGGGGSNAAAGITGIAVPASASYTALNVGGNLVGVSATNPMPVTGSFSATTAANASLTAPTYTAGNNPLSMDLSGNLRIIGGVTLASIGLAGAAAPASVDLIGIVDQSGNSRSMGGAIFHNSDNQTLGATSYGIITGGVAQIVNQSGTLDRQRETGFDGVPAAGVSAGAQQVAGPPLVTTVTSGAIAGNNSSQSITLNAVTFTNRGVVSTFTVGTILLVDTGTAQESVVLTAVNTSTRVVQGVFKQTHTPGVSVMSFAYNQARDATIPDGSTPAGIASSGTYLFNNNTATVEFERSAAGELDGATGVGTNVAAGYEWNGGGPIANGGTITQNQFDRERNLQGKGISATTLTGATTAGATSIVLTAAVGLLPGMQIRLDRNLGTEETVYISSVYVPGALTVVLQSALAQAHANAGTVEWDVFISAGPGLNGFGPAGIGIEESVVYDPVTGKFFIERSATQDAVSGQNVVMEADALFNGVTFDRPRSVTAAQATTGIGIEASGMMGAYNTTAPVLTNGQYSAAQVDASGNLKVNIVTGGGSGSNAAASATGAAVPTSASYTGFNVGGSLVAVSAANPLPITGTISATTTANASAAAPTYTAGSNPLSVDFAGNLRVAGTVKLSDTAGTGITSTTIAGKQRLDVTLAAGGVPGVTASTIADQVGGVDGGGLLRAFSVDATGRMNVQGGNATAVKTDGSAVTQPVSIATMPTTPVTGTFYQATQPVSATALPLPTGAATLALQTTINTTLGTPFQAGGSVGNTAFGITGTLPAFAATPIFKLSDTAGNGITSTLVGAKQRLDVILAAGGAPGATASTIADQVGGVDSGGLLRALSVDTTGRINVQGGNATAVKTDGSAVTQPVSIATMPTTPVTGTFYQTTQPISGSVGVSNFPATQAVSITTMPTTPVTGVFYQTTQPVSIAAMPTTPVTGTFYQTTQPVSGTVAVTGAYQTTQPVSGTVAVTGVYNTTAPVLTNGQNSAAQLDSSGNLKVSGTVLGPLPTSLVIGQQVMTTSAVALPSNALLNGLVVTTLTTNAGTVYVGNAGVTSANGYPLTAGQSISFAAANASIIYLLSTVSGDIVAFAGN